MSEESGIEVYETPTFRKALKKLDDPDIEFVENEIDKIIANPNLGEQKRGDLGHLWVHKFHLNNQQVLLGYSWKAAKLELYLINLGPHENFYWMAKKRRDSNLKIIR